VRPRLAAGIELRNLVYGLCDAKVEEYTHKLEAWHRKWREFSFERTTEPETGKWHYMRKRLRCITSGLEGSYLTPEGFAASPEVSSPVILHVLHLWAYMGQSAAFMLK
jgi:hypothetical protein